MEDFNCSDSSSEMNGKDNLVCNKDFQRIMSMEGFDEEEEDIINTEETNYCRSIGKKKRLSMDQVQGLERIFEVDSKLDQERKIKLAAELGLQPRQVAIWFQNRRARWKTKQLERDFRLLKANYESLQQNYSQIEREKEGLVAELRGLKEKLGEENCEEKGSTENQQVYNYTNYKQTEDLKERLLILASSDNSTAGFTLNEDTSSRLLSDDHNGLIIMDDLSASAAATTTTTTATTSSSSSLMDSSSRGEMMMRGGYCYYDDDHHHHQQQQQQQKDILNSNGDESCSMTMMMPPLPFDQTPFFWYTRN